MKRTAGRATEEEQPAECEGIIKGDEAENPGTMLEEQSGGRGDETL